MFLCEAISWYYVCLVILLHVGLHGVELPPTPTTVVPAVCFQSELAASDVNVFFFLGPYALPSGVFLRSPPQPMNEDAFKNACCAHVERENGKYGCFNGNGIGLVA